MAWMDFELTTVGVPTAGPVRALVADLKVYDAVTGMPATVRQDGEQVSVVTTDATGRASFQAQDVLVVRVEALGWSMLVESNQQKIAKGTFAGDLDEAANGAITRAITDGRLLSPTDAASTYALQATVVGKVDKGSLVVNVQDHATWQAAVDAAPAGAVVLVPAGTVLNTTDTLVIAKPLTLVGDGATLNYTGADTAIEVESSDVTVSGLRITGPGDGVTRTTSVGVMFQGSSAASPLRNVRAIGLDVSGFSYRGIRLYFVDGFRVERCAVRNIVYSGISGTSVLNGFITDNDIRDITMPAPELTQNSYGISLSTSSSGTTSPDAQNPACENILVARNRVHNVPWEGIDTHAGRRISFVNNHVTRCGAGIIVTSLSTTPLRGAPQYCVVAGNNIHGDGAGARPGIGITGASSSEYAVGCVVTGNTISGHPGFESPTQEHGAIRLTETLAVVVVGNTIYEPEINGVVFVKNNKGFFVGGGTIVVDPWTASATGVFASAVRVLGVNNTGTADGIACVRGTKVAAQVGLNGLRVDDASSTVIVGVVTNPEGSGAAGAPNATSAVMRWSGRQLHFNNGTPINRPSLPAGSTTDQVRLALVNLGLATG